MKTEFNKKKFLSYIGGKLIASIAAIAVILIALFTALATVNVQVIAEDAFAIRASVILSPVDNSDTELLSKVFTRDYLNKTELDTQMRNRGYNITNYAQDIDVSFHIVFPWSRRVRLTVTDEIDDISATLVSTLPEDEVEDYFIQSGVYDVTLVKEGGSWLIDELEMREEIETDNQAIPKPSASAETTESWEE